MSGTTSPASGPMIFDPTKVPPGGAVVHSSTTTTQVPVTPPVKQDTMLNVSEAAILVGFVVLIATAIAGIMKWLDGKLDKLAGRFVDELKDVRHDVKEAERRILDVERASVELDKRLIRQEEANKNFVAGQQRIEHAIDQVKDENAAGRAEIIQSLREMSKREIRP